jgi:hypothetical protein
VGDVASFFKLRDNQMRISKTISVAVLSMVGFTNVNYGATCHGIGNYLGSCIAQPAVASDPASAVASDPASTGALGTLTQMSRAYSIIKTCSENNILFNQREIDAVRHFIDKTTDVLKINESDSDTSWDVSQKMIDNRLTWDSCKEVDDNIYSLFPVDIFKDAGEKNPF